MSAIELKNVSYSYKGKQQRIDAVKQIDCSFDAGVIYSVVGKSGSGKSTLLSLIANLDTPREGSICFEGTDICGIDSDLYRRNCVSMIYQDYNLISILTVLENVMYPLQLQKVPRAQARQTAEMNLRSVELDVALYNRYPDMLSGGEQQRVAIARALCSSAKVILADEPTGNLDSDNSHKVMNILYDLAHQKNYCVIVVTHDMEVAAQADKTIKLSGGQIIN
jgi:ABC-type lipoprotein export system ATPase subunit